MYVCVYGQFEFPGSFTIQLWVNPRRVFLGTNVEGGLISCLVSGYDAYGLRKLSGYALTVTSDSTLHFKLVEGGALYDLTAPVTVDRWVHVTAVFDVGLAGYAKPASIMLFSCQGTGALAARAGGGGGGRVGRGGGGTV